MRLSRNKEIIPFNYQHLLTGVIHKWIGPNNGEHSKRSLYSFSWLQNVSTTKHGINVNRDSYFFISAYDHDLIKRITRGILNSPITFSGSRVTDVQLKETPSFSHENRFITNSPILIRKREGEKIKHLIYTDADFEDLLTKNLANKLTTVDLDPTGVFVRLDKSYAFPQTKLVDYKGIKNRTTIAPIIITGSPEQIAFAWSVGIGHSTGIGFGSLK